MPRRFRRKRRRTSYRSRKGRRRATRNYVKSYVSKQIETKFFFDANFNNNLTNNGDVVWCLTDIPSGTDSDNKIGRKVNLKHLRVKIDARHDVGSTNTFATIRVLILQARKVIDASTPSTWPVAGDVLEGFTGASQADWTSMWISHLPDYKLLYDKIFISTANEKPVVNFTVKIPGKKLNDMKWDYVGSAAVNTVTQASGHIFMIAYSDQTTTEPQFYWRSRLRYKDA